MLIICMMEAALDDDDEIFVYMGGNQQVPDGIRRARIHKSVEIILRGAFRRRRQLISVEFHDGVEIIEEYAFECCFRLNSITKLLGVKIIKTRAFAHCSEILCDVEFGDKLETIEKQVFEGCKALRKIKSPTVRTIGMMAFASCSELSDVEFGEGLRTVRREAFICPKLKRIVLPLKDGMIGVDVFAGCAKLQTVDLVGNIHNTVASLHMESWRNEMMDEINRINQTLPTNGYGKTAVIQQWMRSVIRHLNHFKDEHKAILKEATTLLELALWKVNLDDKGGKLASDRLRARKEKRVSSSARIVMKNVLRVIGVPRGSRETARNE